MRTVRQDTGSLTLNEEQYKQATGYLTLNENSKTRYWLSNTQWRTVRQATGYLTLNEDQYNKLLVI